MIFYQKGHKNSLWIIFKTICYKLKDPPLDAKTHELTNASSGR
jgi:hypothetical protein